MGKVSVNGIERMIDPEGACWLLNVSEYQKVSVQCCRSVDSQRLRSGADAHVTSKIDVRAAEIPQAAATPGAHHLHVSAAVIDAKGPRLLKLSHKNIEEAVCVYTDILVYRLVQAK